MYRMLDSFQIVKMGLEDKLQDYEYWCIEWPKTEWIHDEDLIILNIEIVDNLTRKVKEVKRGSKK
jgi:tRNA A37 threonylcarbamoyladenosine biosynthesis protein TsaE